MDMWHASVEVDAPAFSRGDEDQVDALVEQLRPYHGVPSSSPRGFRAADIAFPAESAEQAAATALAVVASAYGAKVIALEVMTEKEFNARQGFEQLPELVSVSEAAELLGVTRQAIADRIRRGTLQATKVGESFAIPRAQLGVDVGSGA